MTAEFTSSYHVPVMLTECIDGLGILSDGTYLDCTLGGGGHFSEIAKHVGPKGVVIGIDRDPQALNTVKQKRGTFSAKVILELSQYSKFDDVLRGHDIKALDGILIDCGVSSEQINNPDRGFTYMQNSPLDMRMNQEAGISAAELLRSASEDELIQVLADYGELRNASRMSRVIKRYLETHSIQTSHNLLECLKEEYGEHLSIKVIARVFQALRIAVNGELDDLGECLEKAVTYLRIGGRIVVLSYHSLEDRIVKNFFRREEGACECPPEVPVCVCHKKARLKRITRKSIKPGSDEIASNRRARSARLRIAERV